MRGLHVRVTVPGSEGPHQFFMGGLPLHGGIARAQALTALLFFFFVCVCVWGSSLIPALAVIHHLKLLQASARSMPSISVET